MWKATSLCLWRSLFWLLATRSLMFFGTIPSFRSSSPPPCIRSWWWPWGAGILDNVWTFFFLSSISINITLFVVFHINRNVHTYIYGHDKSIVTMTSSLCFLLQARLLPWVMIYWDWRSETSVNRRKVFIATNRFLSTTALLSGTTRSQQWLLAIMVIITDIDSHSGHIILDMITGIVSSSWTTCIGHIFQKWNQFGFPNLRWDCLFLLTWQ